MFPPPAEKRVPDAHPPETCIAAPKIKEPIINDSPTGAKDPPWVKLKKRLGVLIKGKIKRDDNKIKKICALIPILFLVRIYFFQAPEKPKNDK